MKIKDRKKQARDVAFWSEGAFLSFTEDLLKLMGEQVSQAELARRVGVSRAYISRVFKGTENLTLETMTKLAIAVGGSVRLHVARQDRVTQWHDSASRGDEADASSEPRARPRPSAPDRPQAMLAAAAPSKPRHHK